MTRKNKIVAKYRILGLVIIFITLFVMAFSVMLIKERLQLEAAAYSGATLIIHENR